MGPPCRGGLPLCRWAAFHLNTFGRCVGVRSFRARSFVMPLHPAPRLATIRLCSFVPAGSRRVTRRRIGRAYVQGWRLTSNRGATQGTDRPRADRGKIACCASPLIDDAYGFLSLHWRRHDRPAEGATGPRKTRAWSRASMPENSWKTAGTVKFRPAKDRLDHEA
jgi:hypothetical protein